MRVGPRQSFDCRMKGATAIVRLEFKPSKTRPSALQHGARAETLIRPDGPEEDGFSLVEPLLTKAISIADGFSMTRLANELALEERLDRMIDRALRRLCQMKAVNRPDTECAESAHPRRCTGSPNRSTI